MTQEEGPSFLEQLQEAVANDPDLCGHVEIYQYNGPGGSGAEWEQPQRQPLQHVCAECGHRFVANEGDLCSACEIYRKIGDRRDVPRDQAQIGRWLR